MTETQLSRAQLVKMIIVRFGGGLLLVAAVFFLPAGTLRYWEAWGWMAVIFIPMFFFMIYLIRNDPELLERRMRTRETQKVQSLFIKLSWVWFLLSFVLPGLDYRFGWSDVPVEIVIASDILVFLGYFMFIMVLRENSFASRVVEVEQGQKVVDTGPYAVVRHPMYLAALVMYLFTPLALGSYWAILPNLAIVPLLVMRTLDEEKLLLKELPGYGEYRQKVRSRVVPGLW